MEFLLARFNAQAQRRAQEVPQTASPSDVRASSLGGVAHLDYRPDIDGLRAIAVLSVVAFHAFPAVVRGGFVGVDVFFVISGYLISGILFTSLERKRFSFLQFYARRIRRIFPALALVLFACLAAGWFLLFSNEYARLGKHVAGSAGFVANLVLWNESGYFDKAAATKPLLHIWSLGIEEQFYFVWPFLLYIIWKRRFWTPVVLAGIFIATFWINIYTAGSGNTAADYYSPLTRFWELAAGALLAYFSLYKIAPNPLITKLPAPAARVFAAAAAPDPFINNLKAMAGLIAVLLAVFLVDEAGGYPGWWALLPVGGTYLMLSAGPKAWLNKRILANRLMVAVGLISYPLYLWHWPLLSFMRIVDGKAPAAPAAALAILLSVVLAWGTYILIEKPIRWGGSGAIKALFLIAVMGVMADAGYYVYISKGVPSRNPAAEDLMAAQKDIDIGETRVVAGLQERAGTYHGLDGAMMIGTPGTDETLLIGDSTMYQYIPRVRQYAEQHRAQMEHNLFVVVGLGACLTLPDITNPASPACAEFMDKAIAAAHLPSVKTVGFAALWAWHLRAASFYRRSDSSKTILSSDKSLNLAFQALDPFATLISQLVKEGKRVFVVLETPQGAAYDPAELLPSGWRRLSGDPQIAGDPKRVIQQNFSGAISRKMREIAETAGATVIDPMDYLCTRDVCPAFSDGHIRYFDSDHLRASFVRDHATYIDQTLQPP